MQSLLTFSPCRIETIYKMKTKTDAKSELFPTNKLDTTWSQNVRHTQINTCKSMLGPTWYQNVRFKYKAKFMCSRFESPKDKKGFLAWDGIEPTIFDLA